MEVKTDSSSLMALPGKLGWLAAGVGLGVLGALVVPKLLNKSKPNLGGPGVASDPSQKEFIESVMREQLVRNYQFFGEEKQNQIRKSFVIVVGVGGVGSHVVNALVRSGISKIRVIDFDLVTVSSLNRSAFALRKDVGKFKSQLLREYLLQINPQLELETVEEFFSGQTAELIFKNYERMLAGNPDMVVDCIDDITSKVDLLRYCLDHKIKVVSSGGAGMKADPTKIQIRDLSETNYDSLSRSVRVRLKEYGHQKGVMCIFSNEITERKLLDLNQDQAQDPEQFRALSKLRVRIVPVLGTMPSIFGMTLASYVLCTLAGEQYSPAKTDDVKARVYQKFVEQINKLCIKQKLDVDFDIEDIYFAAREVCEWRCSATGKKSSGLVLCIWDSSKPVDGRNLLLFSGRYVKDENSSQWNMKSYWSTFTEEEKSRIEELLAKAASTYTRNMILMTNFENNK